MDISYLESYIEPVTMGICLIVGILIKTLKNRQVNQFIPCVVTVIGVVIATVTCMQQETFRNADLPHKAFRLFQQNQTPGPEQVRLDFRGTLPVKVSLPVRRCFSAASISIFQDPPRSLS